MTVFNPENKHRLTYSEALGPAMKIEDKQDAKQYYEKYVEYLRSALKEEGKDGDPVAIAKTNLGYYAGYYDPATYERVMELYDTTHPFFGKEWPTPQNAFAIGMMKGKEAKEKREEDATT